MAEKKDPASSTAEEQRRALENAEPMVRPEERERRARAEALDHEAPLVGDFLKDALDLMQRRADGAAKSIATPWPKVDEALGGGLWPGMHVLTGSTGEGKSQWALQVALQAASADVPTLYVGLELGHTDLVARLLALMMAEDDDKRAPRWSELYLGKNKDALRVARDTYAQKLSAFPLRLEVGGPYGWSANVLRERMEALREKHPEPNGPGSRPLLVVLDYLQVIAPEQDNLRQEIRERISKAAYAGRAVARDLGAVVLVLSSIAREKAQMVSEWRGKDELGDPEKLPPSMLMGLGKESGDIEYSADSVLTLCSGKRGENDHRWPVFLAVAKVRAGKTSWQRLSFNGSWFEPGPSAPGSSRSIFPDVD